MKSTKRDFINEIIRLRLGDTRRHQPPLNNSETATKLGVGRDFVIEMIKLGASHGLCQLEESGRLQIPSSTADQAAFVRLQQDSFATHPLIAEWIQYMRNQNNGEGLAYWQNNVSALRIICNTLKIKPDNLIVDKETTRKLWLNFVDALKDRRHDVESSSGKIANVASQQKRYKDAIRRFCARYGITWARGEDEVMGNKVVGHGKYAHIRLTKDEFDLADKYLKQNYGVDSDLFRIFWVGVESCARDKALFSMELTWDIINDDDGSEIFVMRAFESKTKKHNGGWWDKFVTRKETQDSLRLHKQRGNSTIWTNHVNNSKQKRNYTEEIRNLFRAIGKIPNYDELVKKSELYESTGNYFFDKPIHALRHIGAHYWLEKTDYDYAIVAEFGGWMTIDELKKSYGAMPPEIKYRKLKAAKNKLGTAIAAIIPQVPQAEVE